MGLEFFDILTVILLMLIIFTLIFLIYRLFPKSKHSKKINYQPPSNDPPALINSFFASKINNRLGGINVESFYLTLLDLINRKHVSVKILSKKGNKIILKVNKSSTESLPLFEKNVLRCISALEYKGTINILDTKKTITKKLKVNTFQKNYDAWMKNFYNESIKITKLNMLNNRFSRILEIYSIFLLVVFMFTSVFYYLEGLYLNLIISFIIGFLGVCLIITPFNLSGWTKEGRKLKIKWDLFRKYYYGGLQNSNKSQEFLNEGINYIPYLLALGIPKSILIDNFSKSSNITDTYLFLKHETDLIIKDIIKEFLLVDGSFDPKYYNNTGNFVPWF